MSKISTVHKTPLPALLGKMKEKTKGRSWRTMIFHIAAWLVTMAMLVACSSGVPQPTQAQPSATELPTETQAQPSATELPTETQALPTATELPDETQALDGAALLEMRCSVCHSADRARNATKTGEEWEQTVARMIGKGAQLTEDEMAVLVEYLTNTYAP